MQLGHLWLCGIELFGTFGKIFQHSARKDTLGGLTVSQAVVEHWNSASGLFAAPELKIPGVVNHSDY